MDGYRGDGYMGERGRAIIKSQYVGKKSRKCTLTESALRHSVYMHKGCVF